MIEDLSKEQIAELPEEAQEALARVALDEARFHRGILDQANGYPGYRLVPLILGGIALGVLVFVDDLASSLPFLGILLLMLVSFHVWGLNYRIDGVIRLLKLSRSIDQLRSGEHECDGKPGPGSI